MKGILNLLATYPEVRVAKEGFVVKTTFSEVSRVEFELTAPHKSVQK